MRSPPFSRAGPEESVRLRARFVGDDVRQGGLPEARRAVQQHMVDRLVALHGRFDGDLQGFDHIGLPDVIGQMPRPQRHDLGFQILFERPAGDQFLSVLGGIGNDVVGHAIPFLWAGPTLVQPAAGGGPGCSPR